MNVVLIIPTLNAERDIPELFAGIMQQTLQPQTILIIDSSSTDNTRNLLVQYPVQIHSIEKKLFDHGGTRRLATELIDADIYLMMTQDAIPAHPDTFKNLIHALLSDEKCGCAYGRQLPKKEADLLSIHGRLSNYPEQSVTRSYADKDKYGIKTCFNSDNLAAYRKTALQKAGGFPKKLLTGEDAYTAAKMLQQGYTIKYVAEATIYHSHNLNLKQEFDRYFSVGLFHSRESWIIKDFNSATSEGLRFVMSEIKFLIKHKKITWIPKALISTCVKYFAYQVGMHEKKIPLAWKKKWGVNKSFWVTEKESPSLHVFGGGKG